MSLTRLWTGSHSMPRRKDAVHRRAPSLGESTGALVFNRNGFSAAELCGTVTPSRALHRASRILATRPRRTPEGMLAATIPVRQAVARVLSRPAPRRATCGGAETQNPRGGSGVEQLLLWRLEESRSSSEMPGQGSDRCSEVKRRLPGDWLSRFGLLLLWARLPGWVWVVARFDRAPVFF